MIRARAAVPAASAGPRHAVLLLAGLGLAVGARYIAWTSGAVDGVTVGLAFGLALAGLALLDRRAHESPLQVLPEASSGHGSSMARVALIGLGGGAGLVLLALAGQAVAAAAAGGSLLGGGVPGPAIPGPLATPGPLPPPGLVGVSFAPWAVATIVVAAGEEGLLRGALFGRIANASGVWPAVAVTSVAFALMHVPFYGWRVVPLDLGVGIWLAGLRLATGGVAAPWIAHAVADLATWWL